MPGFDDETSQAYIMTDFTYHILMCCNMYVVLHCDRLAPGVDGRRTSQEKVKRFGLSVVIVM